MVVVLAVLLGGCGGEARRSAALLVPVSPSRVEPGCARAKELEARAEQAINEGGLLRARRLAAQAHEMCASATRSLDRVRTQLEGSSADATELLARARAARSAGHTREAREAESAAVASVERAGGHFGIAPRWSFEMPTWSRGGRYLFLADGEQLLALDVHTGQVCARVPRPHGDLLPFSEANFEAELNPAAERLVVRSESMAENSYQTAVYDTRSGALLKSGSATHWLFSPDGSRLVLAETAPFESSYAIKSTVDVLDPRSMQVLHTVRAPEVNSSWAGFAAMAIEPESDTLAIAWRNGLSLVDLRSGHTDQFATGTESAYMPSLAVGAGLAVWRAGDDALVTAKQRHWRLTLPKCPTGESAVSPDGKRIAFACPDSVLLWEVGVNHPPARLLGHGTGYGLTWLAGGRGLGLGKLPSVTSAMDVLDTTTKQLIHTARATDQWNVSGMLRLATVGSWQTQTYELIYLDANLDQHPLALPGCLTLFPGVTEGDNGVGVVECNTDHGLAAVVVDTKTLSTRSFPINYPALTVDGDELIDVSKDALELRALGSGALLPFSPRGPLDLRYDAFWEGATLVVGLDTGPGALVPRATRPTVHRISHFGATLQTVTEPASQAGPCAGPLSMRRGRFSWGSKPPSTLCDRRSGRVLGDLPALPSTACCRSLRRA
ncbi:MAG: hypothetical protein ABI488_00160 [Polyangiaceae bacterium]